MAEISPRYGCRKTLLPLPDPSRTSLVFQHRHLLESQRLQSSVSLLAGLLVLCSLLNPRCRQLSRRSPPHLEELECQEWPQMPWQHVGLEDIRLPAVRICLVQYQIRLLSQLLALSRLE